MASEILFASSAFERYDRSAMLPAKFERILKEMDFGAARGSHIAIKMHVGRGIGYTTIPALFVKALVDHLKQCGAKPFITDQSVSGAAARGYTQDFLGCPVLDVCGVMGKYFYPHDVDYRTFKNVDVAGYINDAEYMVDLSHVKGHGACGYGGAVKNIAMGCVTDRTRQQIHGLEGGLVWNEEKCTHCEQCVSSCNHDANSFDDKGKYEVFFHNCTFCQHCVKVCPTGAIVMDSDRYTDFQTGMALCTKEVLSTFKPGTVWYINFLINITAVCDCWGFSTPSLVPDIGICAGSDIVAIERACLDLITMENFNPQGAPIDTDMGGEGHLFERLHHKNPYIQLEKLVEYGLGTQEYALKEIK